ncbi:hypothetical protein Scep_016122 [Stephania cephalantha]|uniref:Uncharacterized protein n=1 Tax=Stephania cephalantha TaxID=152367 RepID=A0AAP0NTW8_9MAGN
MSFGRFRYFSFLDVISRYGSHQEHRQSGGNWAEQLKGVRGGRRAQTASYRKSKELRRGKGANEVGDLPNEASASPASEAAVKELAIRTSQVNAAQRPKTDSIEESNEEGTQKANKKEAINLHLSHLKKKVNK